MPAASDPLIYQVKIQGSFAALNFREKVGDRRVVAIFCFLYVDADSGLQIIPEPFRNVILTHFENRDFQKSWFLKTGQTIVKISETCMKFRKESDFDHPGAAK